MDNMGATVLNIGDNRAYKTALDAYSYYWFEGLITETNPDVSLAMYTGMTVDSVEAGIYTVYAVDNTYKLFHFRSHSTLIYSRSRR